MKLNSRPQSVHHLQDGNDGNVLYKDAVQVEHITNRIFRWYRDNTLVKGLILAAKLLLQLYNNSFRNELIKTTTIGKRKLLYPPPKIDTHPSSYKQKPRYSPLATTPIRGVDKGTLFTTE